MTETGPPYPHPHPVPGSNAIGSFAIGVSPIGDIPPFDVWQTVLSQYANAPVLTQLLTNFNAYLDPTANMDAFFDAIWNIDTAVGIGLDIWGRIINVSRQISIPGTNDYFGFAEAGAGAYTGFNQSPFYNGVPSTNVFNLTDDAFRLLLFAKALSNISDGSIASINQLLRNLFPHRGNCYVIDNMDMTMVYRFNFTLTAVELAILNQSGVLPKPVGVSATISHL